MRSLAIPMFFLALHAEGCSEEHIETSTVEEAAALDVEASSVSNFPDLTVGGLTFKPEEETMEAYEWIDLRAQIHKEYLALTAQFGEDVMVLPVEQATCTVRKVSLPGNAGSKMEGRAGWAIVSINHNSKPPAFTIGDKAALEVVSDDPEMLRHELFHLFAQYPGFDSEAFFEGQAHAVMALSYNDSALAESIFQTRIANPNHEQFFDRGWDLHRDDEVLGGGVQDLDLKGLLHMYFAHWWLEFANVHPNFLKDFYKEIAIERANGRKTSFTKEELIAIASRAEPAFVSWFEEKGTALGYAADNTSNEPMGQVIVVGDWNNFDVVNLSYVPRGVDQGGRYNPERITKTHTGPLTVQIQVDSDSSVKTQTMLPSAEVYWTVSMSPQARDVFKRAASVRFYVGSEELEVIR